MDKALEKIKSEKIATVDKSGATIHKRVDSDNQ